MTPHKYLSEATQWLIQYANDTINETTAESIQSGANTMLTEKELGNNETDALKRIEKIHEKDHTEQTMAIIGALTESSGDAKETLTTWIKTNLNQPNASFKTSAQAADAFFSVALQPGI